ncbi:MAG: sugar ABC transporter substrate-binding protein, partial [Lachnospiraceae bacterium]|nr:sugar ABC transporter substrate-binding protein [Lachnospiraceae bacterium]
MKKRILAVVLAATMVLGLTACGGGAAGGSSASKGGNIKVGIINNDPNESGYRTANDRDLKATFSAENGYDASFAYSLKNDEQIAAAQKFIQDGVDYLLLSAADTSGWDS